VIMFAPQQQTAIDVTTKISSSLSLCGSLAYIWLYMTSSATQKRETQYSIIFFLSCIDVVCSLNFFVSSWLANNSALCTFSGWLTQIFLATPLWNCCLSFHFYVRIVLRWNEVRARRLMQWYHALCWGLPLILSIPPVALDMMGPTITWCWITDSYGAYRVTLFYVFIWIAMLYMIGVTILILERVGRLSTVACASDEGLLQAMSNATQAVAFAGAFWFTWVAATIMRIQRIQQPNSPVFAITLVYAMFVPLQGFMNIMIHTMAGTRSWTLKDRLPTHYVVQTDSISLMDSKLVSPRGRQLIRQVIQSDARGPLNIKGNDGPPSDKSATSAHLDHTELTSLDKKTLTRDSHAHIALA
jgi:hypothetical protein